jgi:hypothetical protein
MAMSYSRFKAVIRIISIVSALLTIIVFCTFPPWKFRFKPLAGDIYSEAERFAGYHFIAGNVDPTDLEALCNRFGIPVNSPAWQINLSQFSIHIDAVRLAIPLIATLLIFGFLYKFSAD